MVFINNKTIKNITALLDSAKASPSADMQGDYRYEVILQRTSGDASLSIIIDGFKPRALIDHKLYDLNPDDYNKIKKIFDGVAKFISSSKD